MSTSLSRVRGRELGVIPVLVGIVVIWIVLQSLNSRFLSAENLTNLALQMAAVGTISLGIVFILLLGEVDLSAGSVSGLCGALLAVLSVRHGLSVGLSVVLAIAAGAAVGLLHGLMVTRLGMPSFVVTLAGLIGWQGLQLYVLGRQGTVNFPFKGSIASLSDTWVNVPVGSGMVALAMLSALVGSLRTARRRTAAGLPSRPLSGVVMPIAILALLLEAVVLFLGRDRGVPLTFTLFVALVAMLDLVLRRTVFGRRVYAVGGNSEATRRAGVNVTRIRVIGFMIASSLAATGGILAASRLAAVNQASGGSDTLLNAIAAAVIGGTSLFGGRGRTYAALLGTLVIASITNGMLLLNLDSSIRFMVTGAVLAIAVAIDSVSRRSAPGARR
jgi:D-xylose transport system permease protein